MVGRLPVAKMSVKMSEISSVGLDYGLGRTHVGLGIYVEPLFARGVLDALDRWPVTEERGPIQAFLGLDVLFRVPLAERLDVRDHGLGFASNGNARVADAPAEVSCREPDEFLTGWEGRADLLGVGLEAECGLLEMEQFRCESQVGFFAKLSNILSELSLDQCDIPLEFAISSEAGSGLVKRFENEAGRLFSGHGELSCE